MKKYILLLLSLFAVSSVGYSQTENKDKHAFPGITNWEEVIAKATLDNKYIMVDFSTEWCSWCKVMDKQHFRDPEILSIMTPKLNSYMLDAEKDSVGQLLKLKYGIASYPSFLFFTPQGEYLETWHGSMPKEYWIQYIKDSIDQSPIARPGIPSGLAFNWPLFVQKELKANFKKSAPSKEELNAFFSQCNYKKFTDFNVCRFYPNDIPDILLENLMLDKHWLDSNYGADITNNLIETSVSWKAYHQIQDKNWLEARSYMNRYRELFPKNEWELFNLKLYYFKAKIDVDSAIQVALRYDSLIDDYIADGLVAFICKHGTTESHFKQADQWNSAELLKETTFQRAKHQAQITMKRSDWIQAKKWATIAVQQASKEGVELTNDDKWIIDLAKESSFKSKG